MSQSRHRRGGWEFGALGVVAITLAVVALYSATRGSGDDADRLAVGVVTSPTATSASPSPRITEASTTVVDADLATYQALLTATPVYVAPKPTGTITLPTEEPLPPLPTGIVTDPQGMFSPSVFHATTAWQGQTSAGFMMVYAGIVRDQEAGGGPGAVRVYTVPVDANGAQNGQITLLGDFLAPDDPGELTITGVDGDLLQLTAANGQQLVFNAATQEFE